jgi:CubicO group peptidase (beta-lactamase class C family)
VLGIFNPSANGSHARLAGDMGPERLQAALEDRISAGAPGALARIDASRAGLARSGAAGRLGRGEGRSLAPDDAFRVASVTKNVTATVAVRLAQDDKL